MKNLVIALALSVVSSASLANGFSPWDDRGVAANQADQTSFSALEHNTGFAPWRDQLETNAFANEKGIALDIVDQNIFRPWS